MNAKRASPTSSPSTLSTKRFQYESRRNSPSVTTARPRLLLHRDDVADRVVLRRRAQSLSVPSRCRHASRSAFGTQERADVMGVVPVLSHSELRSDSALDLAMSAIWSSTVPPTMRLPSPTCVKTPDSR